MVNGKREPSPAAIRKACERIERAWSKAERQRRAAWATQHEGVVAPCIQLQGAAKAIVEWVDP